MPFWFHPLSSPKFAPPVPVYERFVARFPFFTTVDQAKAVRDVLDDLASGHPMDRAAAVVLSGKQVAIAVPTTVLARQHVATFRKRFAPFNIELGDCREPLRPRKQGRLYARAARCRSEDELNDLEDETSRHFGKLPSGARDFFAAARLRIDCKRRGIVRLDVGPEAVAATLLPGRLRKSKGRSLQRDGDRLVYVNTGLEGPLRKVEEFLDLLDE